MRSRRLSSALGLALLVTGGGCRESAPPAAESEVVVPSVILVMVDTLRRDHLSLYGYERPTSPQLDALARESIVFEHCLSPSSWTLPSVVSLLSGLLPASHGVEEREALGWGVDLLPEILQRAGYATAAVSGNVLINSALQVDQGFDTFLDRSGDTVREYPDVSDLVHDAEEWLGSVREPFFLYLHVMNVHGPYRAPDEYRERFLELPWEPFEFRNPVWNAIVQQGDLAQRGEVSAEQLRDLRARYDGAIAYTDAVLGEFFARLRAAGVLDRTLLLVTSDHGEELFDHGGFGHGYTLREEVVDVPLLIRLPEGGRVPRGRRVQQPVSLVDIPSTVLDITGLSSDPVGDGTSALRWAAGGESESRLLLSQLARNENSLSTLFERWPYRVLNVERSYESDLPHRQLLRIDERPAREVEWNEELAALERAGRERLAELEAAGFSAVPVELDESTLKRLEALGYLGGRDGSD